MNTKSWIAVGATSALGLGVLASGAISVANAMPLYDMSQATEVPPISTVTSDTKAFTGTGDVRFWVVQSTASATIDSAAAPTPASPTATPAAPTPTPVTPASPVPAPTVQQAPAPQPQPVAPMPGSADSADSADSVDSVDSVD